MKVSIRDFMIPKQIIYIFGLDESFCNKPFSYFQYLNVLSSKAINPDYSINCYYKHRPNSKYFDKLSDFCKLIPLSNLSNLKSGQKFAYTEHVCDLMRLELVYNTGGIYLDIDTVCIRSFDSLLNNSCVMGLEYSKHIDGLPKQLIGLCNAVLMGTPQNDFMKIWMDEFHSDYKSEWNYNCVQMPYHISQKHPDKINIQPQESFFKYSWDSEGKIDIFYNNSNIDDCYSLHLWETKNFELLKQYDDNYIINNNDTLSNIYKKLL